MSKSVYILGLSFFYHDAAACLIKDGVLIAAAEEERFTRRKHDNSFPKNAIIYCLTEAGIEPNTLDAVGFYEIPFLKFERIVEMALRFWPESFPSFIKSVPEWIRKKLWIKDIIRKNLSGYRGEIYFLEHHLSHAASAFLVSPFERAAIFTIDGVGEWATATLGEGSGTSLKLFKEIQFPHSLGLLYSVVTHYLGFEPNSDEYKIMGLAAYGEPTFVPRFKKIIDIKEDGSFRLNLSLVSFHKSLRFYNEREWENLFGIKRRMPVEPLTQAHKDFAASIQKITEEIVIKSLNHLHSLTRAESLCMAGGVALNCVANGLILEKTPFKKIFIQPAAGDAGGALGVAFYIWTNIIKGERQFIMDHAFWGPAYSNSSIEEFLKEQHIPYKKFSPADLCIQSARLVAEGKIIGWFQGRMEWGPRALGARSILADARNPTMKEKLNSVVKFREDFRPFAPTVLEEDAEDYFYFKWPSPFMLITVPTRDGKLRIPAATHVDGSARIQTLRREQHQLYYDFLKEFKRQTGCPVVINTSFNIAGEPIVCTPEEAWRCFSNTNIDYLVIGSFLIGKSEIN